MEYPFPDRVYPARVGEGGQHPQLVVRDAVAVEVRTLALRQ